MSEHIKINNYIPRVQYVADGTINTFEFPFAIFEADNLKVYIGEVLQENNYTVSGIRNSDGGSITFASTPVAGDIITITRNMAIERTTDFQEGGTLRADVLNDELDKQTAFIQQIAENLNRSMVLPPYAAGASLNLTLPYPEAGKAIIWNREGTNLENSNVEINALESTLRSYKEAAAASVNAAAVQVTLAQGYSNTAAQQATNAAADAETAANKAIAAGNSATAAADSATQAANILSVKVNTDGDNFSDNGKVAVNKFGQPKYSACVDLTSSWNTDITAPSNGLVWLNDNDVGGAYPVYFTCGQTFTVNYNATNSSISGGALFPVQKGEIYRCHGGNNTNRKLFFIPYIGG